MVAIFIKLIKESIRMPPLYKVNVIVYIQRILIVYLKTLIRQVFTTHIKVIIGWHHIFHHSMI